MKKFLKKMKKNEKGFTLIELIVVIAIIAILAAVMVPRFTNFSQKAAESAAKQEANALAKMVAMYEAGTGAYPTTGTTPITHDSTGETLTFNDSNYGKLVIDNVTAYTLGASGITYTVNKDGKNVNISISKDGLVTP